jgi:hypothetical protein
MSRFAAIADDPARESGGGRFFSFLNPVPALAHTFLRFGPFRDISRSFRGGSPS